MANDAERARPNRLTWQADDTGETCDLSGHFWAMLRPSAHDGRTAWSWMIIGYENQVLAAGQTGDAVVAKLLVDEWDRWVCVPDTSVDGWDNPVPIADDCMTYQPAWPQWPER